MDAKNLRILSQNRYGCEIQFDGSPDRDYTICVRSVPVHGHQPLVDDIHGKSVWVDDPKGREVKRVNREWVRDKDGNYVRGRYAIVRRRTWTGYRGLDGATRERFAQPNKQLHIWRRMLPGDAPWQIIVWSNDDGKVHLSLIHI